MATPEIRLVTEAARQVWYRHRGRTGQIMYLVSNRVVTVTVPRLTYV